MYLYHLVCDAPIDEETYGCAAKRTLDTCPSQIWYLMLDSDVSPTRGEWQIKAYKASSVHTPLLYPLTCTHGMSFPQSLILTSHSSRNQTSLSSMNTQNLIPFILLLFIPFSVSFSTTDNFLLSCGSHSNASLFNRVFVGDSTDSGSTFLSSGDSISLTYQKPPQNLPTLYHTARLFRSTGRYRFNMKKNGTHLVRFHFSPFKAQSFDLKSAKFNVSVNGVSVLSNFQPPNDVLLKEFILKIVSNVLEILFRPVGDSGFAFVNALEVFTAPVDFVIDFGARLVGPSGVEEYRSLSSQVLETVHRINVGGLKITPFNDTLWRTWIPDEDYLVFKGAAKPAVSTHTPNYQKGGATREIAPENVYMTAQQMNRENSSLASRFNITWNFPVSPGGVPHLVRLHFCDIVSPALNLLYFDVYINGYIAYKDLDLSALAIHTLASPVYVDFVTNSDDTGFVQVSVGPSELSSSIRMNAILNGAEIMKMVNDVGTNVVHRRKNLWVLVGSIAGGIVVLFLVVTAFLLGTKCRNKKPKQRTVESVGWTPLSMFGGSSLSRSSEPVEIDATGSLSTCFPLIFISLGTVQIQVQMKKLCIEDIMMSSLVDLFNQIETTQTELAQSPD
ncbi:hypothetical protein JHK85_057424 [Glycine max]|nr:hypothetical protein JHK85_057424 [Glycine max]